MTGALDNREESVSIDDRTITNLHFADDIGALTWKEEGLIKLVNQMDKASTTFGMDISAEKTNLMTNNTKRNQIRHNW